MAKRRKGTARKPAKRRDDDASLYPLDPETAIRAIMAAGPHPKKPAVPSRRKKPSR